MTNEHYLIVSYFAVGFVSLCLGVITYRALRTPFAAIAELVAGKLRSRILNRVLAVSLTMAAVLGFLGVSYTQKGCMNYEQVVKERNYLVQANQRQLQGASEWIVYAVFAWGIMVVILLAARRKQSDRDKSST